MTDSNGGDDVFLYNRLTDTTTLVSHAIGNPTNAGSLTSIATAISGDGRFVVYLSQAQDLVEGFVDQNGSSLSGGDDVFLFDRVTGVNVLVSRSALSSNKSAIEGADFYAGISEDGRIVF